MFYNRTIKLGRLTKDAESGTGKNGKMFTRFSIAVGREYLADGKRPADFFDVIVFQEGLAKIVKEGGKKGRLVLVEGKDQTYLRDGENGKKIKDFTIHADAVRWLDYLDTKEEDPGENLTSEEPEDDLPF